ncbi:hypothetical protein COT99_00925 [Candidatus Falkowbacteria bacterium CG10_big_fil_rev_8_21_14_0_10_43_10]|uniref:Uncharacterized protein n=1 Tax=Candidatus Falkowbacteria bacterium CG10_big_fil_rev_8_21_14_0_10_43_10 TaxID=1974567 RepID=A0A2H0V2R0_9BACT|nr:MAG: hypothetical protein COT99_00925 [Candidatus Falkowbacteria bacterium CG10_big_fil_rev_8_21_14_0_10_43_10]
MNKTNILAAAVGVVVTTAIVAGATYAYQGGAANFEFKNQGQFMANRQEMMAAVENKDYAAWKKLMDEQVNKLSEFITEENFNKMAALHEAMRSGEGITPRQHEAIRSAIENNDYESWKNLMGDNPIAEKITAENFSKLAASHKLMQEGKFEEAKKIREELGLNFGGKMGRFQKAQ